MEETDQPPLSGTDKCMVCGKPEVEEGYGNKMCADCRTQKSQLAVPLWVKLFATGILLLILIDLPKLPRFFLARLHYERGIKAQNDNRFETAAKEYDYVATHFPGYLENNLRLIVCCERNLDFDGFAYASKRAEGEESEEHDLIADANNSVDIMNMYHYDNRLDTLLTKLKNAPISIYDDSLKAFCLKGADNPARYLLASDYFDSKNYHASDSLINLIVSTEHENLIALSLKASNKREEAQYDSALLFYDEILERNSEMLLALDGKVRVYLKMKNDTGAMRYAIEAYSIDSTSTFSLEAMSLTNYFKNFKPESERLLAAIKRLHPEDSEVSFRTQNIIEGKTIYR
jgi:hypothetical protein